jgi:XrtJ-associated TM-motif-TM protein
MRWRRQATKAAFTLAPKERTTVKKLAHVLPILAMFALAAALPVSAQSGCVDSPENPTAVLGLLVGAASFGFIQVRNRIAARKGSRNK